MSKTPEKKKRFWGAIKERGRKLIVSLKRKPQNIPLVVIAFAFLYYSLNMTDISDTTAKIQGAGMGLCGFCTMLFSILSFVCFLNAFPHRKKVNIPMLVLMFAMFGAIIYCDLHYIRAIENALYRAENAITISQNTAYIANAYNLLNNHIVILAVAAGLIVLLPLYSFLIRKINTSIEVEANESMEELDLAEEE